MSDGKCPVDNPKTSPPPSNQYPVNHGAADTCPVDEPTRSSWLDFLSSKSTPRGTTTAPDSPAALSTSRSASSIPRQGAGTWTYPSEAQFFAAMARKRYDPRPEDMKVLVPIHNAVNERAWAEVIRWERGQGGDRCGGIQLVNFRGRPGERSWKAWWNVLLGHDWIVDRCGTRVRYIIDFYPGYNPDPKSEKPSFYLDVRPAIDNWSGIQMRLDKLWERWFDSPASSSNPAASSKT